MKELYTEQPEWRVLGCALMVFAAIALSLTACGPVETPKPIEASPTKPAITMPSKTEIKMSMVAETSTETNTSTETAIPVPEYIKSLPYRLDGFTLVENQEYFSLIIRDIQDHPVLTNPKPRERGIIYSYKDNRYRYAVFQTKMKDNCAVRAALRTPDQSNVFDRWFVVWEVRVPGENHSHVVITYIGEDFTGDLLKEQTEKDMLARLRDAIQTNANTTLYMVIGTISPNERFDNPVLSEIVNPKAEDQQNALYELEKNHIIPDLLSQFPIWLKDVIRS